jgi:lysyl-tRNA synthetase, class II
MPGFVVRSPDVIAAQERRAKLAQWRAAGVDPFPNRFSGRTAIAAARGLLEGADVGAEAYVRVAGRLTARRKHRTMLILDLLDGSGGLEAHAHRDALAVEAFDRVRAFDAGDIVGLEGTLTRSRSGEPVLRVAGATLLAKALRPPPAADGNGRQAPHEELDLLASAQARELVVLRAQVLAAIRAWLDEHGYVEVDAPILQRARNGDGARPFLTRHHALDRELSLRNSVQLQLRRCIVGGVERVYDLGKCFRNEGISHHHNPEFTMLEWSAAYAECGEAATAVEALVASVARRVLGTTVIERDGVRIELAQPWRRCSVREAILERTGVDLASADGPARAAALVEGSDAGAAPEDLIGDLYGTFVEPALIEPTIVFDWPAELLPLVKRQRSRPELADGFDAVVAGIELASGDSDLNDPDDQAERFAAGRDGREPDTATRAHEADVLATLEYGMPPVGGGGLGVDRLVMLLAGRPTLRDVLMFPEAA